MTTHISAPSRFSLKNSTILSAALLAVMATGASAATYQVTGTFDVTQDIAVGWDPSYYHTNQGFGDPIKEGYVLFDEYTRILTQEANVWDPAQIPTDPATAPTNVISQAQLMGTWTFDADLINNVSTSEINPSIEMPQFLGGTSDVSIFKIFRNGSQIDSGVTVASDVYALNNATVGEGGEQLDIIGINAVFGPDEPGIDSSGATLFMGFADDWFENNTGENFSAETFFSGLQVTAFEYNEISVYTEDGTLPTGVGYGAGHLQYDMMIESEIVAGNLQFTSFGAADGSSEESPLLPSGVSQSEEADAPTFSFNVAGAGAGDIIFIDPEITNGYVYELTGDGVITTFVAPSADAVDVPVGFAGYTVTVVGGALDGQQFTVLPADPNDVLANALTFSENDGVRSLRLEGIWLDNNIDPTDFNTFVAGFSIFGASSNTSISQTALTTFVDDTTPSPVPLPAGMALMLTGLGGLAVARKRRKSA